MFQQNKDAIQLGILNNISSQLQGKSLDLYTDNQGWHNVFHDQVFAKIDEKIFSTLFDKKQGAPNYPINILVGMMVLKEGFGWSDSELFESVRFNILVRRSLGMPDLQGKVVSESCYYLFKQRIFEYELSTGDDLLSQVFVKITGNQALQFEVNGKSVRMDSKLFGSNIARISRFQLVHGTLKKFYLSLGDDDKALLSPELEDMLGGLCTQDGEKIVYRSKNGELQNNLVQLGAAMCLLVDIYKGTENKNYELLTKVFEQQFRVSEGHAQPRPKEELKASNIQSPEDTDADYRKKGDQEIFGGYHANVTETCSDDGLNLITSPEVKPATVHEKDFYQNGVEGSQGITGDKVEKTHTDGAYHSQGNKKYNEGNGIDMVLTGMQGKKGRYDFRLGDGALICTDNQTGKEYIAEQTPKGKSYKIVDPDGKVHYFSKQHVDNNLFRQEMGERPQAELNKRNNVEATIFQLCYFTRNNKVRYRGIQKVQAWSYMRCLWINMVRIKNFMGELPKNVAVNAKNAVKNVITEIFANFELWIAKTFFSISS